MKKTVCPNCGGSYFPDQADGSTYVHTCPPLSQPEIIDRARRGTLPGAYAHLSPLIVAKADDLDRIRQDSKEDGDAVLRVAEENMSAILGDIAIERDALMPASEVEPAPTIERAPDLLDRFL